MRIFLLLVGALLAVGCGANPTDSQVAQAMQATRDDLKLPPEERRVETLSVNKAVELAARENPGELPGPRVAGELPNYARGGAAGEGDCAGGRAFAHRGQRRRGD